MSRARQVLQFPHCSCLMAGWWVPARANCRPSTVCVCTALCCVQVPASSSPGVIGTGRGHSRWMSQRRNGKFGCFLQKYGTKHWEIFKQKNHCSFVFCESFVGRGGRNFWHWWTFLNRLCWDGLELSMGTSMPGLRSLSALSTESSMLRKENFLYLLTPLLDNPNVSFWSSIVLVKITKREWEMNPTSA